MRYCILVWAGLCGALRADPWQGRAEIGFAGASTLHDWAGLVAAQPFAATVAVGEDGRIARVAAQAAAKVAEMDTDNGGRDENLRKAMHEPEHPLVVAKATVDVPPDAGRVTSWRTPVELTLLGRTQVLEGLVSHWQAGADAVRFDLSFRVSLAASGITIPPVLLFIRVADTVDVTAHVTLARR